VRSRPTIPPGIPSDIIDTRDTIGIVNTCDTIGIFHPAPFGIVDILSTIDVRARTPEPRQNGQQRADHNRPSRPASFPAS